MAHMNWKNIIISAVVLVFFVGAMSMVGNTSVKTQDQSPKKEIENLVNQVIDILQDPKLKAPDKQEIKRKKLRELVSQIFDLDFIAHRVLGRYARRFNKEQFEEFKELFTKMLESIYLTRIENYSGEKVVFEDVKYLSPTKVVIPTKIIKDGQEIPVEYRLVKSKKDGKWIGYDVVIEGVSLVKNYRTQFYQYLKRHSVDELLEMMREKVKQLSKQAKTGKS
ncbi:MAG: hypothetical protein GXO58_11035 [Thermodesulfobacteria bacterium]|nr:hypothetical protein [Thermodesulfobacteriota bacterium]